MVRTLILLRHGKSDWSRDVSDRGRPLTDRGRRQAAEAGVWLAAHAGPIDLALVSPARRASDTWALALAGLDPQPATRTEEAAYTFDGAALLAVVRGLGEEHRVVLVGHNPACEQLLTTLTGQRREMPTSALAVVELADWGSSGRLVAHGRPPG
jgi:phosphohistidine phosphatase